MLTDSRVKTVRTQLAKKLILVISLWFACSTTLFPAVRAMPAATTPDVVPQVDVPVSATGAIAVDLDEGIELFAKNPDTRYPPASTVKIVTALLAKQILDLDESVVVEEQDLVAEEYSRMGLQAGDIVTVRGLLYGLLIPSGGDAALALARYTGQRIGPGHPQPVDRFVEEMNRYAERIGMTNSHFTNPVGFEDQEMYTTARDLVRATSRLLDDWLLARIVSTPWTEIHVDGPEPRDLVIENTNEFVLSEQSFGVKTGTTDSAGECLVNAVRRGGHRIITVVLGSQDRYADTSTILGGLDNAFAWMQFGAGAASLGATEELAGLGYWMPVSRTVLITAEQSRSMSYNIALDDGTSGPIKGTVAFYVAGNEVARLPVYSR